MLGTLKHNGTKHTGLQKIENTIKRYHYFQNLMITVVQCSDVLFFMLNLKFVARTKTAVLPKM